MDRIVEFTVYCFVIAALSLFYFFYCSRISGLVASYVLSLLVDKASIRIQSITVAPLSGKIMFTNFTYTSINQSVHILSGHVSIRYWLLHIRKSALGNYMSRANTGGPHDGDEDGRNNQHPCRIKVRVDGLQWYIYNRIDAYQQLLAQPQRAAKVSSHEPFFYWQKVLPIEIEAGVGTLVIGNNSLPTILVVVYTQAKGLLEAVKSPSSLDYYTFNLSLDLLKPKVQLRNNADYKEPATTAYPRQPPPTLLARFKGLFTSSNQQIPDDQVPLHNISRGNLSASSSIFPQPQTNTSQWSGLPRYQHTQSRNHPETIDEYARISTILECDSMLFLYYSDVVGPVLETQFTPANQSEPAPTYGFDLIPQNAIINYGPWADRQRDLLQSFFFPQSYRDQTPTTAPQLHEDRVWESLKVCVTFEGETRWRVPFREFSRELDEEGQYFRKTTSLNSTYQMDPKNAYGWLDFHFGCLQDDQEEEEWGKSTLVVNVPLVIGEYGYGVTVDFLGFGVDVLSSVNSSTVLGCEKITLNSRLDFPLKWNAPRRWNFTTSLETSQIHLLRDHITLLTDLVKDFAVKSRKQGRAYFVPVEYQLDFLLNNVKLWMCVNEQNVVDKQNGVEENCYFTVHCPKLEASVLLPFTTYQPETSEIPFNVKMQKSNLAFSLPSSHTIGAFAGADVKNIGSIGHATLSGNYRFCSEYGPESIDSLVLIANGSSVKFKLFGFLIKYIIHLKDNYFGDHINTLTSLEYRTRNLTQQKKNPKKQDTPLDFHLIATFIDVLGVIPHGLYSCSVGRFSIIRLKEVQVDNRNSPLFHDLQVNTTSILWSDSGGIGGMEKSGLRENSFLKVHGLCVRAHRLIGCTDSQVYAVDWNINFGDIISEIQPSFVLVIIESLQSFMFHFRDKDNLLEDSPALPDLTTIYLSCKYVDWTLIGKDSASILKLAHGFKFQTDNFVCQDWTDRTVFSIPDVLIRSLVISAETADDESIRECGNETFWVEVLKITTCFSICIYKQSPDWNMKRNAQREFIKKQDNTTGRVKFMYQEPDYASFDSTPSFQDNWNKYCPPFSTPFRVSPIDYEKKIQSKNKIRYASSVHDMGMFEVAESDRATNHPMVDGTDLNNSVHINHMSSFRRDSDSFNSVSDDSSHNNSDYDDFGVLSEPGPANLVGSAGSTSEHPIPPAPIPKSIPYKSYLHRYKLLNDGSSQPYSVRKFVNVSKVHDLDEEEADNEQLRFDKDFLADRLKHFEAGKGVKRELVDEEDRTIVSFYADKSMKVLITPVCLKILEEFLEAIDAKEPNLEAMLDEIQIKLMAKLTFKFNFKFSEKFFFFHIPQIHIHCIQDMDLPDKTTFFGDSSMAEALKTKYELSDNLLCSFDILFHGIEAQFFSTLLNSKLHDPILTDFKFTLGVDSMNVNLKFVGAMNSLGIVGIPATRQRLYNHFDGEDKDIPVVLDIISEKIVVKLECQKESKTDVADIDFVHQCNSTLELGRFSVISVNQTVEIMFGSLLTWFHFVRDLFQILSTYKGKRFLRLQRLVYRIIELERVFHLDDLPLFMSNPSDIWSLANRDFQSDFAWKLIFHLRNSLKQFPPNSLDEISGNIGKDAPSSADMYKWLCDVLAENVKGNTAIDVGNSTFFADLFNQTKKPLSSLPEPWNDLWFLLDAESSLHIDKFDVSIFEYESDENSLFISPFYIDFGCQLKEISVTPGNSSVPPSLAKSANPAASSMVPEVHFLDVIFQLKQCGIDLIFIPSFFGFIRHAVRVYRWFQPNDSTDEPTSSHKKLKEKEDDVRIVLSGTGVINHMNLSAVANNLISTSKINECRFSIVQFDSMLGPIVESHLKLPNGVFLERLYNTSTAHIVSLSVTISEKSPRKKQPSQLLASLNTDDFQMNTVTSRKMNASSDSFSEKVQMAFVVKSFILKLPRSLLKLQAFLEKWGDEDLPRYDFLLNKLMSEFGTSNNTSSHMGVEEIKYLEEQLGALSHNSMSRKISCQLVVDHLQVQSDLLDSLKFFYDLYGIMLVLDCSEKSTSTLILESKYDFFGVIKKHEMRFHTKAVQDVGDAGFLLPSVRTFGSVTRCYKMKAHMVIKDFTPSNTVVASLELEKIETTVNVNMIDQLFTAYTILGNELNDIVEVFSYYNSKNSVSKVEKDTHQHASLNYDISLNVEHVRIIAESNSCILLFESTSLKGFFIKLPQEANTPPSSEIKKDRPKLKLDATGISLSLVHLDVHAQGKNSARYFPLAYVLIDGKLLNYHDGGTVEELRDHNLFLTVSRLYAVMQPNATGELADFLIYYKQELDRRRKAKDKEIKKLKQYTARLLQTLNIPMEKYIVADSTYFSDRNIVLKFLKICIAIPIHERKLISLNANVSSHDLTGPAFLVGASLIEIRTSRFETLTGSIVDLSAQFVKKFDQSNESNFSDLGVHSRNRILLKKVSLNIKKKRVAKVVDLNIDASIRGFELEINHKIGNNIKELVTIYDKSKSRMSSFYPGGAPTDSTLSPFTPEKGGNVVKGKSSDGVDFSNFFLNLDGKFEFESGFCKIHCRRRKEIFLTESSIDDEIDQLIMIPAVSMKLSGKTVYGMMPNSEFSEQAFHLGLTIHPTENIIHPSIVLFFDDVKSKFTTASSQQINPNLASSQLSSDETALAFISKNQHTFTLHLRLSQTLVKLSCQPLSKVICSSKLEEANFFLSFTPRGSNAPTSEKYFICLSAEILGLFFSLRHSFSPEDCILGKIEKMSLNVSRAVKGSKIENHTLEISIPSVTGGFNLRHIQDFFEFQRLWVNTPMTKASEEGETLHSEKAEPADGIQEPVAKNKLLSGKDKKKSLFCISFNLDSIFVDVDLGQSIGKASLKVDDLFLSSSSTFIQKTTLYQQNLAFGIKSFGLSSNGRFSGTAVLNELQFLAHYLNPFFISEDEENCNRKISASLRIANVKSHLQYHYEHIFVGEFVSIDSKIFDEWKLGDDLSAVIISLKLDVESINAIISQKTSWTFVQMFQKISALIEEKRLAVLPHLSNHPPSASSPSIKPSDKNIPTSDVCNKISNSFAEIVSVIIGEVDLKFGHVLLSFTRYNFKDPECAQIFCIGGSAGLRHELYNASNLETKFPDGITGGFDQQIKGSEKNASGLALKQNGTRDETIVHLQRFEVRKTTIKTSEVNDEVSFNLLAHLEKASSKYVLSVPSTHSVLFSSTDWTQCVVEYALRTDFDGHIDIALNIGLYKFLKDLVQMYVNKTYQRSLSEASFEKQGHATDETSPTSSTSPSAENLKNQIDLTKPLVEHKMFKFVKNGDVKFDPKLKLTGDATPLGFVDWLGFHKDDQIPEIIFSNVTENLQFLFHIAIKSIYEDSFNVSMNTKKT